MNMVGAVYALVGVSAIAAGAIVLALISAAEPREGFVLDEDLVDEFTRKRVHIKLYDEFVEKNGRRPTQSEYDGMLLRYQARFRETGIHPLVSDIVPGGSDETVAEKATYWAFVALVVVALLAAAATTAYMVWSGRKSALL
jgi:hypothetical protein